MKQDEHLQTERDVFPGNDLPRLPGILWKHSLQHKPKKLNQLPKSFSKRRKETTAEPAVNFNVFLFDTKDNHVMNNSPLKL